MHKNRGWFLCTVGWAGESDRQRVFVCNPLNLPRIFPVGAVKSGMSYGTHDVDHLAADGTGLLGGQIAVVALLERHAHLVGSFHLEAVEGVLRAGNKRLIARHCVSLLFANHVSRVCSSSVRAVKRFMKGILCKKILPNTEASILIDRVMVY